MATKSVKIALFSSSAANRQRQMFGNEEDRIVSVNPSKIVEFRSARLPASKAARFRPNIFYRFLAFLVFLGIVSRPAMAAQLAGVALPDTATVGSTQLMLNGIGVRTYSFLNVQIYVAGLYLEHRSHDAPAIISSGGFKLLQIRFIHDVDSDAVRRAWRTGLLNNCSPPCVLAASTLSHFLGGLRSMHTGDTVTFVFRPGQADAYYNGLPDGQIRDPQLSKLILAVFIGQKPASPRLKDELLGKP